MIGVLVPHTVLDVAYCGLASSPVVSPHVVHRLPTWRASGAHTAYTDRGLGFLLGSRSRISIESWPKIRWISLI